MMCKLFSIANDLEVGDQLVWIASHSIDHTGERTYPHEVTGIERTEEVIRVEGEGIRGGQYQFEVNRDGESEAYFHNPNQAEPVYKGPVVAALRTDSLVEVEKARKNLEDCD